MLVYCQLKLGFLTAEKFGGWVLAVTAGRPQPLPAAAAEVARFAPESQ
jgi:hypothetical protein